MEAGPMKNIVVLKNLPSNIVEEAIVVLKPNLKIKQTEFIDKSTGKMKESKSNQTKDYIVREAEMLVSDYISTLDKQKGRNGKEVKKMQEKYKRLKMITLILSGIILFNVILRLF